MSIKPLDRLCAACGIATEYRDAWGRMQGVPVETRHALLAAMGFTAGSDAEIAAALEEREARGWRQVLAPVKVAPSTAGTLAVPVTLPAAALGQRFEWTLDEENGARHAGTMRPAQLTPSAERRMAGARFVRFDLVLPAVPAPGYHRLAIAAAGGGVPLAAAMSLITVPARCYVPAALERGRVWGPAASLPSLRSRRNWGIGDYGDLRALVEFAARSGAAMVGVLPLHALFPRGPQHASPYSPASRLLLNVLLLDPEAIPDFAECAAARERVATTEFQARLRALRGAERLDYSAVAELKFAVLELLYENFRERHLGSGTQRALAFRAFQQAGGEALRTGSLFYALQEHLARRDAAAGDWRSWPEGYRDPGSGAVAAFARRHARRIEFHDYLQWIAELQLDAAGKRSRELGLRVGLYRDLAVGAHPGGAEAWAQQRFYARGFSIGCPPDEFNLNGQDWGLPPAVPDRLVEAGYASFIALLQSNMRHAGALRIDHVMGLMRLFWVPEGEPPARGGYVAYPFDDMLGILALESERNRCLVVGEDLGTLPAGLGERLDAARVLSCRLLYFERETDGEFKAPRRYPARALAAIATHDLPTLRSYWQGRDLDLRADLGLYPSRAQRERQAEERARDRARLVVALEREGLLPAGATARPVPASDATPELALAVHRYLARTPAIVLAVQPENVLGQIEQANVPATADRQHPNWRHRLALDLEQWDDDERFQALAAALNAERAYPS